MATNKRLPKLSDDFFSVEQIDFSNLDPEKLKDITYILAEGYYNVQKVRIAFHNQIRMLLYRRIEDLGLDELEPKKSEEQKKKSKKAKKYSDKQLVTIWNKAFQDGKITEVEHRFMLLGMVQGGQHKNDEKKYTDLINAYLESNIVYTDFLSKIRGIASITALNLMRYISVEKFDNVGKLWSYCGLTTLDGVAIRRKKGQQSHFNSDLRSFIWVISNNLMKLNKGYYRQLYLTEKEKQFNREYPEGFLLEKFKAPYKKEDTKLSKLHAHNRALRKVGKWFISQFYEAYRELHNLPRVTLYVEEKLGHKDIVHWQDVLKMENTIKAQESDEESDEESELDIPDVTEDEE